MSGVAFESTMLFLGVCCADSHDATNLSLHTGFCYECLPPLVFSCTRAERVKYDNFMSALEKVNLISDETRLDEQVTKWAYNIMSTRSFGEGMQKAISPLADMVSNANDLSAVFAFCDVTCMRSNV